MRLEAPTEQIQPGQCIAQGRYLLLEVLGRGGLATVFAARDTRDGSEVAVKVLCDRYVGRPEREERLRREFEYAARIDHPAIISVYEQGTLEDGRPYFSMERVHGRPLSQLLSGSGGLPFPRVHRLARALAAALEAVHRAGIVHRDVKPDNVLVVDDDHVTLIDFGIAGDDDAPAVPVGHSSRLTRVNDLLGTHEYMAPEQVLKRPPRRSMDVFALGVVMYELLSSITPYSGMGVREYVQLQLDGDPLLRTAARWGRIKGAPPELAELIDQCRRRDPAQRPVDMGEVIRRLDAMAPALVMGATVAAGAPTPVLAPAPVPSLSPSPVMVIDARDSVPMAAATVRPQPWWRRTPMWAAVPVAVAVSLLWLSIDGPVGRNDSGPPAESGSSVEPVAVGTPGPSVGAAEGSHAHAAMRTRGESGSDRGALEDAAIDAEPGIPTVEDAPSMVARPVGRSSPRGSPKARPKRTKAAPPSAPSTTPDEDECALSLTRARAAFASYRWSAVLAHTRAPSCWAEHQAEYLMMRTEALMEMERWAECVRTGRRSSDPGVRRHAERCQKRLATITDTP
ncbi:MAG: protein kinase [Myxococcales bacterium]|nr:protein kinase [Myxococcales bacterium]